MSVSIHDPEQVVAGVPVKVAVSTAPADAVANARNSLSVEARQLVFNGTTWDRMRGTVAAGILVDTELPTAAILADATANPTVPGVGSFVHGYNGTTWDRLRSTIAQGLEVDVTQVQGSVTVDSELPAAALLAEATATPTTSTIGSFNHIFNGTTWDFLREGNDAGSVLVDITNDTARTLGQIRLESPSQNPADNLVNDTAFFRTSDGQNRALTVYPRFFNGAGWDRARSVSVGDGAAATGILAGGGFRFNGSTWDRFRGNTEATVLASSSRAATTNSADQTNFNAVGATFYWDVTVNVSTETLQLLIQERDSISGNYHTVADTGAIDFGGAVGDRVIKVYPGIGAASGDVDIVTGFQLPRTYRARVVHGGAGAATYSVSASYTL